MLDHFIYMYWPLGWGSQLFSRSRLTQWLDWIASWAYLTSPLPQSIKGTLFLVLESWSLTMADCGSFNSRGLSSLAVSLLTVYCSASYSQCRATHTCYFVMLAEFKEHHRVFWYPTYLIYTCTTTHNGTLFLTAVGVAPGYPQSWINSHREDTALFFTDYGNPAAI